MWKIVLWIKEVPSFLVLPRLVLVPLEGEEGRPVIKEVPSFLVLPS